MFSPPTDGPLLRVKKLTWAWARWLAASQARTMNVCAPSETRLGSSVQLYGAARSVDCKAPSRKNSTRLTPWSSLALTWKVVTADRVCPETDVSMWTVGGRVSGVVEGAVGRL